jgi:hypothetical protein
MSFDYATLDALRLHHPAWRLLRSDHAPPIAGFLHRIFIAPNVRVMAAADLAEALEDELYALRERLGDEAFPRPALEYLNDWASPERGWLRKFYAQGSDEPQFDLTPAAEKAIAWLGTLTERSFVGTESRLLTPPGVAGGEPPRARRPAPAECGMDRDPRGCTRADRQTCRVGALRNAGGAYARARAGARPVACPAPALLDRARR